MFGLILCLVWLFVAVRGLLFACYLAGAGVRWLVHIVRLVWFWVIPRVSPALAQPAEPGRVPLTPRERERRRQAWLASVQ